MTVGAAAFGDSCGDHRGHRGFDFAGTDLLDSDFARMNRSW